MRNRSTIRFFFQDVKTYLIAVSMVLGCFFAPSAQASMEEYEHKGEAPIPGNHPPIFKDGDKVDSNIEALVLTSCQVTDRDIENLVRMELTEIKSLILNDNEITNKGFEALMNAKWPKLERMDLTGNKITGNWLPPLNKGNFPVLKEILADEMVYQAPVE